MIRAFWNGFRFGLRLLRYSIGLLLLLFLLQRSTFPINIEWNAVAVRVLDYHFDFVGWELNAIGVKAGETLYGLHPFMNEADRTQYVRDYMTELGEAQRIEGQINDIYTDPNIADPDTASAELRAQRDSLRADLRSKQALVEAILEGQVATVLVDQGFGTLGQLLPPIAMHFTQQPDLLVISPRDHIHADITIMLNPVPTEKEPVIEAGIDQSQNVSSLIVPIGGLALFPAMVVESTWMPFITETFAHEWLHNYLVFFPLGLAYFEENESVIINETTANLFGKEVGRLVLERYYPDLVPPPPTPPNPNAPTPPAPAFDFGQEMRDTRVMVDKLLAEGKIDEAEAYMEERRKVFVAHGYAIRKLNQAYFAFYGNYQSGEPGVGGEDPIGPAVSDIRAASPSLYDWIVIMRGITTREQLLAVRDKMRAEQGQQSVRLDILKGG